MVIFNSYFDITRGYLQKAIADLTADADKFRGSPSHARHYASASRAHTELIRCRNEITGETVKILNP
jgi:hypothetical protein